MAATRLLLVAVHAVVGCSVSSYDYKCDVWDEIEYQYKDLEQTNERVDHNVEGISRNGIPFGVHSVHPITSKRTDQK
jgi:hypothetical protein